MENLTFTSKNLEQILEAEPIKFPGSFHRTSSNGIRLRFVRKASSYSKRDYKRFGKELGSLSSYYSVYFEDGKLAGFILFSKVNSQNKIEENGFSITDSKGELLFKSRTSGKLATSYAIADAVALQIAAEILAYA